MTCYIDTSAALKILVTEKESEELRSFLGDFMSQGGVLISSMLIFTELKCSAARRGLVGTYVDELLRSIDLITISDTQLRRAATSGWGLRSADSIHLAVALECESDLFLAYDRDLLDAAAAVGLSTNSPSSIAVYRV